MPSAAPSPIRANLMPEAARSYLLHSLLQGNAPLAGSAAAASASQYDEALASRRGNASVPGLAVPAHDLVALANMNPLLRESISLNSSALPHFQLPEIQALRSALSHGQRQQQPTNQLLHLIQQQQMQNIAISQIRPQTSMLIEELRQDQRIRAVLQLLGGNAAPGITPNDALPLTRQSLDRATASIGLGTQPHGMTANTRQIQLDEQRQLLQALLRLQQPNLPGEGSARNLSLFLESLRDNRERAAIASNTQAAASLNPAFSTITGDRLTDTLANAATASNTAQSSNSATMDSLQSATQASASTRTASSLPPDGACVSPRVISLALGTDENFLSEYQMTVRKQLEFFVSQNDDIYTSARGRKKKVYLGQVGIRCRHCATHPLKKRGIGAVYYPAKLSGVYQAAQNMASSHLSMSCPVISDEMKESLRSLRDRRDTALGGKQYWVDACRIVGLFETDDGIWMRDASHGKGALHGDIGKSVRDG